MYNVNGLVVYGKELKLKDQLREINPLIVGVVKMKVTKEVKFGLICPEGYVIGRRDREDKRSGVGTGPLNKG